MLFYAVFFVRVADPVGVDKVPDPTVKKKPDPDPTPVKHSGFRIQTNKIRPQLFSVNTKVNIIDILLLNYVFDQKIFKDKFDNILTLEGY